MLHQQNSGFLYQFTKNTTNNNETKQNKTYNCLLRAEEEGLKSCMQCLLFHLATVHLRANISMLSISASFLSLSLSPSFFVSLSSLLHHAHTLNLILAIAATARRPATVAACIATAIGCTAAKTASRCTARWATGS